MENHENAFGASSTGDLHRLGDFSLAYSAPGLIYGSPEKFEAVVFELMQSDEFKHLRVREIIGSLEVIKESLLDASEDAI